MDKDVTEQDTNKAAAAAISEAAPKKVKPTFGMNVQHWGTYITVDWFWNYLSGMAFAAFGRYTPIGRVIWKKPATAVATFITKDLLRIKPEHLETSVGNTVAFMSVIAGGSLFTIPPLTILEKPKNRKSIAKYFDEMRYGKEKVANDPHFQEAYDSIDHEPKKSTLAGHLSRYVSLAPLLLTVMWPPLIKRTRWYFGPVERGSEKIYNAVGITKKRLYGEHPFPLDKKVPGELTTPETEWNWLHSNSAVDFGLEPWYAALHMVTFGIFSKMLEKKPAKQAAPEKKDVQPIVAAPTRTPANDQPTKQPALPAVQVHGISREPTADTPYLIARGGLSQI